MSRIETTDVDFLGIANLLKEEDSFMSFVQLSTPAKAGERIIYFDVDEDDPGGVPQQFVAVRRSAGHLVEISELGGKSQTRARLTLMFVRHFRDQEDRDLQNALVGIDNDVREIMADAQDSSGLRDDGWHLINWSLDPAWPMALSEAESAGGFDGVGHLVLLEGGLHR